MHDLPAIRVCREGGLRRGGFGGGGGLGGGGGGVPGGAGGAGGGGAMWRGGGEGARGRGRGVEPRGGGGRLVRDFRGSKNEWRWGGPAADGGGWSMSRPGERHLARATPTRKRTRLTSCHI